MSKYTPGPWEWDEDESGGPGVIHAGKTLVAYFPWSNCNESADARLIAAAPDLLAALEGLVGAAYGGEIPLPIAGGAENSYWRDAVAAIDKVK